jgi:SAM-dependent methyltransferase
MTCTVCGSCVRQRALIYVLNLFYPNYKELSIHQSSPGNSYFDNMFLKLPLYSYSHYFSDIKNGTITADNIKCVDLNYIPYDDNSFDIFITLDVFEHLFQPETVIKEIYRVVKPGGCFIMTVPIENLNNPTEKACYQDLNKLIQKE